MNKFFNYNSESFAKATSALYELAPDIILQCNNSMHKHRIVLLEKANEILEHIYSQMNDLNKSRISGRLILRSQLESEPPVLTRGFILAFNIRDCTKEEIDDFSSLIEMTSMKIRDYNEYDKFFERSQWNIVNRDTYNKAVLDIPSFISTAEIDKLHHFARPLDWIHFDCHGVDNGDIEDLFKFLGLQAKPLDEVNPFDSYRNN